MHDENKYRTLHAKLTCKSDTCIPVGSLDASYIDAEVFTLLHCDHLRRWLKTELLHHGLEVVLPGALRREREPIVLKRNAEKKKKGARRLT